MIGRLNHIAIAVPDLDKAFGELIYAVKYQAILVEYSFEIQIYGGKYRGHQSICLSQMYPSH